MKKYHAIFCGILISTVCSSFACASEFMPLNFEDATYSSTEIIAAVETVPSSQSNTTDAIGSQNMQSAISKLDNAQVEVRNELLNYKSQYAEVDAKYNTIKAERAKLIKQIRASEKKINQLDKTKEKIRKNMV